MAFDPVLSTAILAGYLALTLLIGLLAWKRGGKETLSEYLIADRKLNKVVGFFSVFATLASAASMIGFVGYWYKFGLGAYLGLLGGFTSLIAAVYYYLGPKIWEMGRKHDHITPSDLARDYFGSKYYGYIVAFFLIVGLFPYLVVQFKGARIIIEFATGNVIPVSLGVYIVAGILSTYILLGGMRSVAWTDLFQGILLLGGTFIGGLVLVMTVGGGFENAFNNIAANNAGILSIPDPSGTWTWAFILGFIPAIYLGSALRPHSWIRLHYFEDKETVRNLSWKVPAVYILIQSGGFFAVLAGALVLPNTNPDHFLLALYKLKFSTYIFALIASATLAALMSTAGSIAHGISVVLQRDYAELIKPEWSDQRQLLTARILTVTLILGALWISSYDIGLIADLAVAASAITASTFIPQVVAIVKEYEWVTTEAAIIASILGASMSIVLLAVPSLKHPFGVYGGFYGVLTNVVLFVGISKLQNFSRNP